MRLPATPTRRFVDDRADQAADHRAEHLAPAAEQAGAADDAGRDRVQHVL